MAPQGPAQTLTPAGIAYLIEVKQTVANEINKQKME